MGKNIGERGIRTLGTKNLYNGLAISRFRPLSHLSNLASEKTLQDFLLWLLLYPKGKGKTMGDSSKGEERGGV
jgi:hypothetical protein